MSIPEFLKLMLPYTLTAWMILLVWLGISGLRGKRTEAGEAEDYKRTRGAGEAEDLKGTRGAGGVGITKEVRSGEETIAETQEKKHLRYSGEKLVVYLILFVVSLLAVAHILPFEIPMVLVLLYTMIRDRDVLRRVDYSLLATFLALFIFIGNLGRIPAFSQLLERFMEGRETLAAILASQVMSNVPAAVLLSGFTDNYQALIIGTNLGGLGTLIASMASLISFKYIAQEDGRLRGKYLLEFTGANIVFLVLLSGVSLLISVCGI